jgi:D-sedoheptulose 7-phosphate isomerase
MKSIIKKSIQESINVKQELLDKYIDEIEKSGMELAQAISKGGKLMFCGNGGSAADAQHLVAELVVRFRSHVNRPAIAAVSLTVDPSIMTAGGNDIGFDNVFARQVEALGKENDVLIGISTSGNSPNVLNAVNQAKEMGIKTFALLGGDGGEIGKLADSCIVIPSKTTARIQEAHITIGHILCEIIEEENFKKFINK